MAEFSHSLGSQGHRPLLRHGPRPMTNAGEFSTHSPRINRISQSFRDFRSNTHQPPSGPRPLFKTETTFHSTFFDFLFKPRPLNRGPKALHP